LDWAEAIPLAGQGWEPTLRVEPYIVSRLQTFSQTLD
jgi:hypothetical protein